MVEATVGEEAGGALLCGEVGGGLFELFAQHGAGGGAFAAAVGQGGFDEFAVQLLLLQALGEAQAAVAAAFAVYVAFGVAPVGLPIALGKLLQQGVDFGGVFGVGREFAPQFCLRHFPPRQQI